MRGREHLVWLFTNQALEVLDGGQMLKRVNDKNITCLDKSEWLV